MLGDIERRVCLGDDLFGLFGLFLANADIALYDALKMGLVSFDSTIRSNLAVGLPIDLAVIRRDDCTFERRHRIEAGDGYFQDISERWSKALVDALVAIPRPPYASE